MHCFVPVPMSMWSMDGLLVACVMDRDGIWVAVCVGCVWGSVYVCVCVEVRKVKGTCEILRHVLNKIHISIYILLVSKSHTSGGWL